MSYNTLHNYSRERNVHRRVVTTPVSTKHESLLSRAAAGELLQNAQSQVRSIQTRIFGKTNVATEGGDSSIQPFGVLGLIPQQEFVQSTPTQGESGHRQQQSRIDEKLKNPMLRAVTTMSLVTTSRSTAFTGLAPSQPVTPNSGGSAAASKSAQPRRPFFMCNDPAGDTYPRYASSDRTRRLGGSAMSVIVSCHEGGVEISEVCETTVRPMIPLFKLNTLIPTNTPFAEAFSSPLLRQSPQEDDVLAITTLQDNILSGKLELQDKVEVLKSKLGGMLGSHTATFPARSAPTPSYLQEHITDIMAQEDFTDVPDILDACLIEELVDVDKAIYVNTAAPSSTAPISPASGAATSPAVQEDDMDIDRPGSDDDAAECPISEVRLRKIIGKSSQQRSGGTATPPAVPDTNEATMPPPSPVESSLLSEDIDAWRGYRNPTHLCTIALLTKPFRIKHPSNSISAMEVVREELASAAFPSERNAPPNRKNNATRKGTWWAQKVLIVRCSTAVVATKQEELRKQFLEEGFAAPFIDGALNPPTDDDGNNTFQDGSGSGASSTTMQYPPYLSHKIVTNPKGIQDGSQEELKERIAAEFKGVRGDSYSQLLKYQMSQCGVVYEVEREHTFRIVPAVGIQSAPMPVLVSIQATPRITREVHVCHQLPGVVGRYVTRNARRPVVVEGGYLALTTAASYGKYAKLSSEEEGSWAVTPTLPTDQLIERLLILAPTTSYNKSSKNNTPTNPSPNTTLSYEECSGLSLVRDIPSAAVIAEWKQVLPKEIGKSLLTANGLDHLAQREQRVLTTVLGEHTEMQSGLTLPSMLIADAMLQSSDSGSVMMGGTANPIYEGSFLTCLVKACAAEFKSHLPQDPKLWMRRICGDGGFGRTTASVSDGTSPGSSSSSTTPSTKTIPLALAATTVSVTSRMVAFAGTQLHPGCPAPRIDTILTAAFKHIGIPICSNSGLLVKKTTSTGQSRTSTPSPSPIFTFLLECVQTDDASPSLITVLQKWCALESTVNHYAALMGAAPISIDLTNRKDRITPSFICFVVNSLREILVGHHLPTSDIADTTNPQHPSLFHLAGGVIPQYIGTEYASRLHSGDVGADNIPFSWVTAMKGLDTAVARITNTMLSMLKFRCEIVKIVMSEATTKSFEGTVEKQLANTKYVEEYLSAFKSVVEPAAPVSTVTPEFSQKPHPRGEAEITNDRGVIAFLRLGQVSKAAPTVYAGHFRATLDSETSLVTDDIQSIAFSRDGRHMAVATTDGILVNIYRLSMSSGDIPTDDKQHLPVTTSMVCNLAYILRRGRQRSQLSAIQFSPMGTCVSVSSAGSGAIHVYLLEADRNGVTTAPISLLSPETVLEGPPIKVLNGEGTDCEKSIRELSSKMDGHRPDLLRWPYPLVSFVDEKRVRHVDPTPSSSSEGGGTNLDPSLLSVGIISASGNTILLGTLTKRGAPTPALHWATIGSHTEHVSISKFSGGFVGWGVDCSHPERINRNNQTTSEDATTPLPPNAAATFAATRNSWRQEYHRVAKPVPPPTRTTANVPSAAIQISGNVTLHGGSDVDITRRQPKTAEELSMIRRFAWPRIYSYEEAIKAAILGEPYDDFVIPSALTDQAIPISDVVLGEKTRIQLGIPSLVQTTSSIGGSPRSTNSPVQQATQPTTTTSGPAGPQRPGTAQFGMPVVNSADSVDFSRFADQARNHWATQEADRTNESRESLSSPTWQNVSVVSDEQTKFTVEDVE